MTSAVTYSQKTLSSLGALAQQAGGRITSAIHKASSSTGVAFDYLLQQANVESSFKADAKARTSSATGLYQFIESTWLDMVDKYGDKYNIKAGSRSEILALRKDPEISSYMAAEFAAENRRFLANTTGKAEGDIGSTELYMAHFLGAGGASNFLQAMKKTPYAPAADIMPAAARANRAVFYDPSGRPRSLAQVYERFDKKFDTATASEIASVTRGLPSAESAQATVREAAARKVHHARAVQTGRSILETDINNENTVFARARSQARATGKLALQPSYVHQPNVIPTGVNRSFFAAPEQLSVLSVRDGAGLADYRSNRIRYNG